MDSNDSESSDDEQSPQSSSLKCVLSYSPEDGVQGAISVDVINDLSDIEKVN